MCRAGEAVSLAELISAIDRLIWGVPLMVLLVGTGLYLTVRLRLVQFRGFGHAIDVLRGRHDDPGDPGEISHFQALCSALSGTIGLGNVVGVAAAILMGGPGAVFWMWVTALVGMASKFTSCTLAVHHRRIDANREAHAGPMHYIDLGMGPRFKWLAIFFAVFTTTASFGIGNMFQINNLTASLYSLVRPEAEEPSMIFKLAVGIAVAVLVGAVILGGIKSIGRFVSKVVPFMCAFYVVAGLVIVVKNYAQVPAAFSTIFYYAFHRPEAITGGLLGTVIRQGVARGLFSNEAGMGSAAMVHGAARTNEPVREGMVAMLGPFIDTIIICSITALVIVMTDGYRIYDNKAELTAKSFELGLGTVWGVKLVGIAIIFFALSTLITWSYYGDRAADYLFGKKAVRPYRFVYLGFVVLGSCVTIDVVIDFCDAMNGLMALPNLIALIVLSPRVVALTKQYFGKMSGRK
jgi:AGCS family alanine or glycine:cation symporter